MVACNLKSGRPTFGVNYFSAAQGSPIHLPIRRLLVFSVLGIYIFFFYAAVKFFSPFNSLYASEPLKNHGISVRILRVRKQKSCDIQPGVQLVKTICFRAFLINILCSRTRIISKSLFRLPQLHCGRISCALPSAMHCRSTFTASLALTYYCVLAQVLVGRRLMKTRFFPRGPLLILPGHQVITSINSSMFTSSFLGWIQAISQTLELLHVRHIILSPILPRSCLLTKT
jgi:hypothetical protein